MYYVGAQPAGPSKGRWISDAEHMFELEIRGGSPTDLELPVAVAKEGDGR